MRAARDDSVLEVAVFALRFSEVWLRQPASQRGRGTCQMSERGVEDFGAHSLCALEVRLYQPVTRA